MRFILNSFLFTFFIMNCAFSEVSENLFLKMILKNPKIQLQIQDTIIPVTITLLDSTQKRVFLRKIENDSIHLLYVNPETSKPQEFKIHNSRLLSVKDTLGEQIPFRNKNWPEIEFVAVDEEDVSTLEVLTETPGASVIIDSAKTEYLTPIILKSLAVGWHEIEVHWHVQENFWAARKRFYVAPQNENGQSHLVWNAELERGTPGMNIYSEPTGAQIIFKNRTKNDVRIFTPWVSPALKPGWQQIQVVKDQKMVDTALYLDAFVPRELIVNLSKSNEYFENQSRIQMRKFSMYSALSSVLCGVFFAWSSQDDAQNARSLKIRAESAVLKSENYQGLLQNYNEVIESQNSKARMSHIFYGLSGLLGLSTIYWSF